MCQIEVIELDKHGDHRGELFSIDSQELNFFGSIKNIHYGTIDCNAIRGNHYHLKHKEILLVTYSDRWSFFWSSKNDLEVTVREFQGKGSVLIKIEPGMAHAIKNAGKNTLQFISLTDTVYDKHAPDTYAKLLVE